MKINLKIRMNTLIKDRPDINYLYSCSQWAEVDPNAVINEYIECGKTAYEELKNTVSYVEDLSYNYGSSNEKTKLDIWGEVKEDLVIFIHGGYWQEGDRKSCVAPAISLVENGIAFASIGYNMGSEKFPLSELIREVIAAIQYLLDRYPHIKNITLGGHSAGAQLAYKSASIMRCPRIKRLALLAGVYQLEELVTCEIGKVIGLTFEEAKKNSCQACELRGLELSVQLLIGKKESPRLLEQNRQLISRLENEDGITTYYEEFPDLNHYSLINGLRYPSSPQTQRLLSFLGKLP